VWVFFAAVEEKVKSVQVSRANEGKAEGMRTRSHYYTNGTKKYEDRWGVVNVLISFPRRPLYAAMDPSITSALPVRTGYTTRPDFRIVSKIVL
jgi:hypothetical protein